MTTTISFPAQNRVENLEAGQSGAKCRMRCSSVCAAEGLGVVGVRSGWVKARRRRGARHRSIPVNDPVGALATPGGRANLTHIPYNLRAPIGKLSLAQVMYV